MKTEKLILQVGATALLLLLSNPAAAQSLNWVHHSTGVNPAGPAGDIAIGFTGPWVNVFYQRTVGQNTEIRGIRQFPAPNPTNNAQYVPYPAPFATFPSTVEVDLSSTSRPLGAVVPREDIALLVGVSIEKYPSELFLIGADGPQPEPPTLRGVEAVAFRPNGQLVTFRASDLLGLPQPVDGLVGAGATDVDVALVDASLVNAQNNIFEIRYRQTAYGTGIYLPPVVVASVPGLEEDAVDFTMTASGIPHVLFSHSGTRAVVARQFDPKVNSWTTKVLDVFGGALDPCEPVYLTSRGELVAATWTNVNPNNPNATALDLRVAIKDGDGDWQVSTVCTACAGNPEQLDITFGPDGFPVIAYVSPTNQLMVAYDPLSPEPALPGDVNLDGVVDRSDVALMALQYGTAGFPINATTDLDGDHRVVLADLAIMQANLDQHLSAPSPAAASAVAAIPEPFTIWLAVAACVLSIAHFKSKSTTSGRWSDARCAARLRTT